MCLSCSPERTQYKNSVWLRNEQQRIPYMRSATKVIDGVMKDIQQAVADRYEEGNRQDAADATLRLTNKLKAAYTRIYMRTSGDFANRRYEQLKRVARFETKSFQTMSEQFFTFYIQENRFPLITTTTETVKRLMQTQISTFVDQGLGVDEIVRQINAPGLLRFETERIVRTEIVCASNLGDMYGAKATGLNMEKEWIAEISERTRDSHVVADGQTVPLDQPFIMDDGDRLDFPGDNSYGASAANTINCRCALGYNVL